MKEEQKKKNEEGVTRRDFMKTAAITGTVIGVSGAVGLGPSKAFAQEKSADIVVVGSGGGGLCSALTAASKGAKVVMIEKSKHPGGMTNWCRDMFGVGSKLQKKVGIKSTVNQAFLEHMHGTHWLANARVVRAFMERSGETIDWLANHGVKYDRVVGHSPDDPDALQCAHLFKGLGMTAYVKPMLNKVQEHKNIEILMQTPIKKILMEGNRVSGVIAENKDKKQIRINAKAVIICGGGYQDNKKLMSKYAKGGRYIGALIPNKMNGEATQLAWEAGAAPDGLGVLLNAPTVVKGETHLTELFYAAYQPYMWVNMSGERFCDETIYREFPYLGNAMAVQPEATAFCVFDEKTKNFMRDNVIKVDLLPRLPKQLSKLDANLERGIKQGKVFRASSVKELAKKIGVPADAFQSSVDTYNNSYDRKKDSELGKEPAWLNPIKAPKFYAIKLCLKALISFGGIKVSHRMEVLDSGYKRIPGLYAAGSCAAGLVGDSYLVSTTGAALGFTSTSGRIAGENATKNIGI